MEKQETGKGNNFSFPSRNAVCDAQGNWPTPSSPKLAANFKAELNPAVSDNVLENYPCVSFTADDNGEKKQETVLEIIERRKWRKAAINVSIASLAVSVLFCAASFFGSATTESSSVLASALDTLLAMFSASVVIWRFCGNDSCNNIGPKREKYGSIAFGIVFTFNGLITIAVSSLHLLNKTWPRHSNLLWPSLMGFSLTYCVLTSLEFWISKKLSSSVLISLCIDDGVTTVLLFGLGISALVFEEFPSVWYLDHTVAIVLAFLILAFGIKLLVEIIVYKKLPFQVSN